MFKYKLTVSDLEIEYFRHQIETLNKIADKDTKEEVYENFFNDLWNDIIDDFEYECIGDIMQQNLYDNIKFVNNRLRSFEILEDLSTYTVFNLFTESHIKSEEKLNVQLIEKYLEDFLKRQNNIENVRKIKIVAEE